MIRRALLLTRRGLFQLVCGVGAAATITRGNAQDAPAKAERPAKPFFDDGTDFTK